MEKKFLRHCVDNAFSNISPAWPLKNSVAVNSLLGFESKHFRDALLQGAVFFQNNDPQLAVVERLNKLTVQWLQLFFDTGQATLTMPDRSLGFFASIKNLVQLDAKLMRYDRQIIKFVRSLPGDSQQAMELLLQELSVESNDGEKLCSNLVISLPGWASYIQYYISWNSHQRYPATYIDYVAMRLLFIYILDISTTNILKLFQASLHMQHDVDLLIQDIEQKEQRYQQELFAKLEQHSQPAQKKVDTQFVFCIDVRSEPIRRKLEQQSRYETYGFAGFFGVSASFTNQLTKQSYDSCPVLLKPEVALDEVVFCDNAVCEQYQQNKITIKKIFNLLYKALKYTFMAPFALVEILGPWSWLWMFMQTATPRLAHWFEREFYRQDILKKIMWPDITDKKVTIEQQVQYAYNMLTMIGLVKDFADVVVLTSHASQSMNNAHESALDCGACGGNQGLSNAKMLASILNNPKVRKNLVAQGIVIPETTYVLAAEHVTSTDEVILYDNKEFRSVAKNLLIKLKQDLAVVQKQVSNQRAKDLQVSQKSIKNKHIDWSEVRPEWGLARNASLIVGPRELSEHVDLQARSFLHSYDWKIDQDQKILTTIMTAPMVVAYWINTQYLFSTIDNVSYGSGSKITQNVTGKIGVMQGNASDLMTGLSLQSVGYGPDRMYHEPIRLTVIIHAPKSYIQKVMAAEKIVKTLVDNQWVHVYCSDPETKKIIKVD